MAATALTKVLEQMLESYRDFETLAGEKNQALVAADFQAMDEFTARERALAERIQRLEAERQQLSGHLSPDRPMTLKELAASLAGQPDGERLNQLREELLAVTDSLRALNGRNLRIIEKSLDIVDRTLKTVAGVARESSDTYNPRGFEGCAPPGDAPIRLLDVRV